jgi:hypothetical protein
VNSARESARSGIEAAIDGDVSVASWLRVHPELAAYVERRTSTLTDLYADLRRTTDDRVDLGRYTGFFDVIDVWMHGADLTGLADYLDYYTVIAYESNRRDAGQHVRTADRLTTDHSMLAFSPVPRPSLTALTDAYQNMTSYWLISSITR